MSTDTTNGFEVQGEFVFYVHDNALLPPATHQRAMDHVRRRIEDLGGAVVRREDSQVLKLRARLDDADEQHLADVVAALREFTHHQISNLGGQYGETTVEAVQDVLLGWADDLESGDTALGGGRE